MLSSLLLVGLLASQLGTEGDAPTSVLVLATPHLEGVQGFEHEMLEPLLAVLEAWAPDAICVEAMPGRTLATMASEEEVFGQVLAQFAGRAVEHGRWAQDRLAVDRAGAAALLREESPERSRLDRALEALAAYEVPTAMLHWAEWRSTAEPLPEDVSAAAAFLDARVGSANEIASVALPLARRLGLNRIHAVDDHLDKDDFMRIAGQLMQELEGNPELAGATSAEVYAESQADLSAAIKARDLLPYYLHLNSAAYGEADVHAQWEVFLRTRLPSGLDRSRLALWDVRNLNIASNVRRASAGYPGGRVLVVIGAGHRPFLEDLLGAMLDVQIVQLPDVAGQSEAVSDGR